MYRKVKILWLKKQQVDVGFTLLEILISLAISGFLLIGVFASFDSQNQSYIDQQQVAAMQQNSRAALYHLTQDIHRAGYHLPLIKDTGFQTATATSFRFAYFDIDSEAIETITYQLYDAYSDGDFDLGKRINNGVIMPVAEHIEQIEFFYTLADGTQTTSPTNLNRIVAIDVSILARTEKENRQMQFGTSFRTASGDTWTNQDGFRRRFLSSRIQCRNRET
ncbi:MAG: hypothetical protein HQK77_13610 [Desulfobacterales bacterium]|nr:hypothetical protein [Desulfobacterales bacterium]